MVEMFFSSQNILIMVFIFSFGIAKVMFFSNLQKEI